MKAITSSSASGRAFSLIEVIVVSGLLSVIILGLVLMFGQTQRAYKLGTTQVDVMESGRMVTDLLSREVSQMQASYGSNVINTAAFFQGGNPLMQELAGNPGGQRTNLLMDFFFLTRENQTWTGIGYTIMDPQTEAFPTGGIGTLYRYETNAFYSQPLGQLYGGFTSALMTNMSRIIDGVVHFKVRVFDPGGYWVEESRTLNVTNLGNSYSYGEPANLRFLSNAIPASVEIELGVLEEKTLERARSISDATARRNYLAQQVGKTHVFRWRVPVRNVDASAYPAP